MDWEKLEGKRVFVKFKKTDKRRSFYTGTIVEVDSELKPLIFVTLLDKFNKPVQFITSEVIGTPKVIA